MKKVFLLVCLGVMSTFIGCKDDVTDPNIDGSKVAGYIYTTTNGQGINQVVRFSRLANGDLTNETAFSTNSLGGANVAVGGDAHGDYDFQGSIKMIGNYLLTVNSGGNNVSVFSVDHASGNLALLNNVPSGGKRPVSITSTPVVGSSTEFWVIVANQWDNPNIQKAAPNIQRFPNNAFFMQDLTQPDASDQLRNIQLFKFNTANGSLSPINQLATFVRDNGGPSQVLFSPDGKKIAVSLWGIAHFGTPDPLLTEQHPSRVYIYDFNNGVASNGRFFQESGIAGTIGIDWAPTNNNILYATNFNTTVAKTNNSLTVLTDGGTNVTKTANFSTGTDTDLDEACWTVISPSGDRLYVDSFTGNLITPFQIGGNGATLTKLPFEKRGDFSPAADSKDMYITKDNKYLYNTGAFQSFSINKFEITAGGVSYKKQFTLNTTKTGLGTAGAYNFMGLVGFDL